MFKPDKSLIKRGGPARAAVAALAAVTLLLGTSSAVNAATATSSADHTQAVTASSTTTRAHRADRITSLPVSFTVENVNRSKVDCPSDGGTYTVRGHITGPTKKVMASEVSGATLFLHGLSFGEFFWKFQQAAGYDFAENLARQGEVSVTIDRLGYGSSDKLDGNDICVGSRADITHQIAEDLKSGSYQVNPSGSAPRFSKVVLAGHSYGGQIAQVAAYSFGDIDGLVVVGYSDRIQSDLLKANAAYAADVCATGGLRVGATGPAGYAPFGPPEGAPAALFASAEPSVQSAAVQQLTINPCGDTAYFSKAVEVDLANLALVTVPVLVVAGSSDALFPPPAVPDQASLFTGSSRVEQTTLPGIAHAIALERIYGLGDLSPLAKWLRTQTQW
jgi:pimeloyl-ACP methyl ester carboxylesterase